MITCCSANIVLRCAPSSIAAISLAITFAEANDSQAWANSVSLSMSGATTKIVLGVWAPVMTRALGFR
ncbi:hypothetical protein D3C85_1752750 [compost metagenome]